MKNIFVLGTNDFNLIKLKSLRRANEFEFYKLLDYSEFRGTQNYDVEELLTKCRQRLDAFKGPVDALVGYFDFPVTDMIPILSKERGLPSASLTAILKCEHKYWSRLEQTKVVPAHIPPFQAVDPFEEDALAKIELPMPFWIKPVKSFRSYLSYKITSAEDWDVAMEDIRVNIRSLSEPFQFLLDYADTPDAVDTEGEQFCIAEGALTGRLCTFEGYMCGGQFGSLGIIDSVRYADSSCFQRYEYPSSLPADVQDTIVNISERVVRQVGLDNTCFNIEFFYNEELNRSFILEINPRISQSHGDLFQKVDGTANHEAMIDVACGQKPNFPQREGPFPYAAKFMHRVFMEDGFVRNIPSEEDLRIVRHSYPGALVDLHVRPGMRLSELLNQDSYSYELADIYVGAHSREELVENYEGIVRLLNLEIDSLSVPANG